MQLLKRILLLLPIWLAQIMAAQTNLHFSVVQYNSKKGLKQNSVHALMPMHNNRILLSTYNGLVQFDGDRFTEIPFSKIDNYKFYNHLVKTTAPEKYFVANPNGACYQIHPSINQLLLPSEIKGIKQVIALQDKIYFVNQVNLIFSYNVSTKKFTKHTTPPVSNYLKLFATQTNLYLGIDHQLYQSDAKLSNIQSVYAGNGVVSKLTEVIQKSTRFFYILVNNQLLQAETKTGLIFKPIFTKPDSIALDFFQFTNDSLGNFYLATPEKIYHLNIKTKQFQSIKLSSYSINIRALSYQKNLRQLLVGTMADGLFVLRPNVITSFTNINGFISEGCTGITLDPDSNVYIGTLSDKVYTFKKGILNPYTTYTGFFTASQFINGRLWMGTYGGQILTNPYSKAIEKLKVTGPSPITQILYDDPNHIWVAHQDGLCLVNSKLKVVNTFSKEIKNGITCVKKINANTLVAAGRSHIYMIENERVKRHFSVKEGLNVTDVRCIYTTTSGLLLFGTYGKGLFLLRENKLISINGYRGCLLPDDIFCLAKDKSNTLWMTTNNGLYAIKEVLLERFIRRQTELLIPRRYDAQQGLEVEEFNGAFMPNYCYVDSNTMLFPTIKGFSQLHLDLIRQTSNVAPITEIESIQVNDTLQFLKTDSITFLSTNNTLRITFRANNFDASANLHYQYKLEGLDGRWSLPTLVNEARFALLPSGDYTFKVKAVDANALNHPCAEIKFTVVPTLTETLVFKVLMLGTLLFIVALIAVWRLRSFKQKVEEQNLYEAKIAQVELRALHAQINPHFIFNCLNSIKYCVSAHNFEAADKYIDHFSTLLRRFLEYSSNETISINEEAGILIHYLELEKYRFNNKFNYFLEVEPNLREQFIPTNIIQPFVENAIKHGIAHAENLCNLHITIITHKSTIRCIIDDDGIGREASKKINESFKKHVSKGLGLIKDKKDILKKISKIDLNFEIIDKKGHLNEESLGTKVIIDIPFYDDKSINNRGRTNRSEFD